MTQKSKDIIWNKDPKPVLKLREGDLPQIVAIY